MKTSLIAHGTDNTKELPAQPTGVLCSHHIFLLPFKWSSRDNEGIKQLPDLSDLKEMSDRLKDDWDNQPFQINTVANYNEWHYFYEYVRKVLYETSNKPNDRKSQFIRHFRHKFANGGTYTITTPCPKSRPTRTGKETYHLLVDEVYLHLYDTGVGVLSFHLDNRNPEKSTPEDILLINQYGRRVFPPFYLINPDLVGTQSAFDLSFTDERDNELQPHGKELAHKISISFQRENQVESYTEDWSQLSDDLKEIAMSVTNSRTKEEPQESIIPDFKPAEFCRPFLKEFYDPTATYDKNEKYYLQSVLDDRMFTVCWYGSDIKANDFGPTWGNGPDHSKKDGYLANDWWYQFVFIDGLSKTIDHPELQADLIRNASYLRWAQRGTWYGVTDYSFVVLTSSLPTLKKFDAEFLVTHLQSIYYKLVELTLVQRSTVQRFSDEVTTISRLEDISTAIPNSDVARVSDLANASNDLYKRYIRFVNGLYFREVTAQVQGIELYNKLQTQSRLPVLVKSLNDEVHELHNYVRQETDRVLLAGEKKRKTEEEDREKRQSNILAFLSAIFLAPGLLVATHDIGYVGNCLEKASQDFYLITLGAAVLSAGLCWLAFPMEQKKDVSIQESSTWWKLTKQGKLVLAALGYIILLLLPFIYGAFVCSN